MRMRFRALIGKKVVTRDGRSVGRIMDLRAERDGEALRITTMLVGPSSLVSRFSHAGWSGTAHQSQLVPWESVVRIGRHVHLGITFSELTNRSEQTTHGGSWSPHPADGQL